MTGRSISAETAPRAEARAAPAAGRLEALDLARFVMALFVVGAHGRMFIDISYPLYFYSYVGGFMRIIIPMFLMISGYFFAVQVKRGVGRWAKRLLILHLIWSTIYIGAWMPPGSFSALKAAFWYFFGAGHLWFMPSLIGGGLMLYWLRDWPTGRLLALAAGLYATGGALQYAMDATVDFATVAHHNALYAVPRNFLFYGFPFVALGHVMARPGVLERVQGRLGWPLFAALIAALFVEITVKYLGFSHEAVFETNLAMFPLAAVVFAWLLSLRGVRAAPWMAPMSAGVYFVHALVLMALEPVAGLTPTLLTLVAVVISVAAAWVLMKLNGRPIPLV